MPVRGNYHGPGRVDVTVFRPSTATWYAYPWFVNGCSGDCPGTFLSPKVLDPPLTACKTCGLPRQMTAVRVSRRFLLLMIAVSVATTVFLDADAQDATQRRPQRVPEGPLLTVRTPEEEQFELSLDELELEPQDGSRAAESIPSLSLSSSISFVAARDGRSILRVSGASGSEDLLRFSTDLEAANAGSRVNWVLYRPEFAKTLGTRILLTREVGLILDDDVPLQGVFSDSVGKARAVPGVANAYVVEASDPMSALNLVERLRQRPGIRTVYSLVKRQLLPR